MKTMNFQSVVGFACLASSGVFATVAHAGIVGLGSVRHLPARPTISYSGSYAPCFSSSVDASGMRTIIEVNIWQAAQSAAPGMVLKSITIQDSGTNAYGPSSPGADVDLLAVSGADPSAQMAFSYAGPVSQHMNESAATLAARVLAADAIAGDTNTGMTRFVSLGLNGALRVDFRSLIVVQNGGSEGGEGGSGPGSSSGGENSGGSGTSTEMIEGLLISQGMRLFLSEAGAGETLDITFEFASVPAPGAFALLGLAGIVAGKRRRAS
ncbi:MAG: hypothetical protein EXS10_05650 [Phycisphaerales bacterium]|nr:hypothetical protein [Phycisphaerales bacterium]